MREFSAPVIIENKQDFSDLALLASHDPDPFARWDASQNAAHDYLSRYINSGNAPDITPLLGIWENALNDKSLSPAYLARLLSLPALRELVERNQPMDPQAAITAWDNTKTLLGQKLSEYWQNLYKKSSNNNGEYSPDPVSAGKRDLQNLALSYLLAAKVDGAINLARTQFTNASNMTESIGALNALLRYAPENCQDLLTDFHDKWQDNPLVIDRWFSIQASAPSCSVDKVKELMQHPDFSIKNPNRARSVIFRFCMDNLKNLHTPEGYDFWADQVLSINLFNPEVAARLARAFDNWSRYAPTPQQGMLEALKKVHDADNLSRNVNEIISKALGVYKN